ncbi:ATP phosphoribosyltransferase regulatory subunit [Hyphomonas sp. UBA2654]|uniref:ATP phosphoribosyltransferase regulatory subunit n=1 Tax=Hyphomonas sp. UBA2654 TaxID=1946619 RepID=UPI0025C41D63|nr:ATP phosphoribosyltransferase regulatory subunit [Hyphomonas sp. UBA2654]|tara:strand:+ start:17882 stop:19012 length:1131 start_codon:yes stop_codon:yes gene_type:complete
MTHETLAAAARGVFEATGAEPVDPAYILPSDIPLELSGEAVRARLCVFSDHRGNEMVMRPDLTLPVAGQEADRRAAGGDGAKAYTYAARAFRLPASAGDPMEFTQVGFEWFGKESGADADAEAFALVREAVAACDVSPTATEMGDLSIFPAFVDALGLARITTDLLKRAFRQEGGVSELLDAAPQPPASDLQPVLDAGGAKAAEDAFLKVLSDRGIPMIGTRSVVEIVAGLRGKSAVHAAGGVPEAARAALSDLAGVNCPAGEAADVLATISDKHGLAAISSVIERVARRMEAILSAVPGVASEARFRSGFGRRFTYYDGFVFESFGENLTSRQPLASGGRYDGLIEGLSRSRASASGIGGVVRPDRILRAKGEAA